MTDGELKSQTMADLRQLQTNNPRNLVYSAPESGENFQQSPQIDIFSFGVLMIIMWTARFPVL